MTLKKPFATGFVAGSVTVFVVIAGILVFLAADPKIAVKTDGLFTPLGQTPPPVFPDPAKPFVYGFANTDWSFRGLDGHEYKLGDFRGKVVFLHYWTTWCAGCRDELGYILWLQRQLSGTPVAFVLISDEDARRVKKFLTAFQVTALPVYITTEKPPSALSFFDLPMTYIIAANGAIVFRYPGAAHWDETSARFLRQLASAPHRSATPPTIPARDVLGYPLGTRPARSAERLCRRGSSG